MCCNIAQRPQAWLQWFLFGRHRFMYAENKQCPPINFSLSSKLSCLRGQPVHGCHLVKNWIFLFHSIPINIFCLNFNVRNGIWVGWGVTLGIPLWQHVFWGDLLVATQQTQFKIQDPFLSLHEQFFRLQGGRGSSPENLIQAVVTVFHIISNRLILSVKKKSLLTSTQWIAHKWRRVFWLCRQRDDRPLKT